MIILIYYVGFSFCFTNIIWHKVSFLNEQNQYFSKHKLSPRSPTMAFSSVRENVTPNKQLELCWKMLLESAITIIRKKLEMDPELHTRTTMKVEQIISLLEFCLKTTYFQFQGRFYEQLHGAAMGSPISPIVANLYMEDFETKAISSAVHPPSIWKRFVDDTFIVIKSSRKEEFLDHINNLDPNIQFSTEDAKTDGSLPFLDTLIHTMPDNSLLTSVYRKPTHTDLYLQWNSHHHLSAKYSVINTLRHRAKTVCSNRHLLEEEEKHPNRALSNCRYPTWALNRARININRNKRKNTRMQNTNKRPYIVVPYMKGLSETMQEYLQKTWHWPALQRKQHHQAATSPPKG